MASGPDDPKAVDYVMAAGVMGGNIEPGCWVGQGRQSGDHFSSKQLQELRQAIG